MLTHAIIENITVVLKKLKSLTTTDLAGCHSKKKAMGIQCKFTKAGSKNLSSIPSFTKCQAVHKDTEEERQTVQRETQGTGELHSQKKCPH